MDSEAHSSITSEQDSLEIRAAQTERIREASATSFENSSAKHKFESLAHLSTSAFVTRPRYIDAQALRAKFSPVPSLRTVRSWTKARIIPSVKIGGLRFYDEEAVINKIERRLTLNALGAEGQAEQQPMRFLKKRVTNHG
jgi:hypothetical protein